MAFTRTSSAIAPWSFDRAALLALGRARRTEYAAASPYPYVVIDDLLGPEVSSAIARSFPAADHPGWRARDYPEQRRLAQLLRGNAELAPELRWLLAELCGAAFLDFLGALSARRDLIADPHFTGAGPLATPPDGYLAVHTDFNRDSPRHLTRVLTALYYTPSRWRDDWGGELELWDRRGERCEVRLAPRPDRLVVMAHGEDHWHGHPRPVTCPVGEQRAVVAAYYYAAEPNPEAEAQAHGARWLPSAK